MRALRGDTRDKSPYLTALSAVTVATAPKSEETHRSIQILHDIGLSHRVRAIGRRITNEKRRVHSEREYSSREDVFVSSVNIFQASSQSDLRNATIRERIIQSICLLSY